MNSCLIKKIIPVLFLVIFFSGCNGVFYQPSKKEFALPEEFSLSKTDFYYPSINNVTLHAILLESQKTQGTRALAVVFHGNAENLSSHFRNFIWLVNSGVDVLIFDYSGYGKSEGHPNREQVHFDGLKTLQWVDTTFTEQYDKLVLIGQSLGGAVLMSSLQEFNGIGKVDLLIIDSSFLTYRGAAKDILAKMWLTWPLQPLVPLLVSEARSPVEALDKLDSLNKWVMHCRDDAIVSYSLGKKIYAALNGKKTLITGENCGHIGIFKHEHIKALLLAELNITQSPIAND